MQAVAQAIRNTSETMGGSISETIEWGKYLVNTENDISQKVEHAVSRVMDGHNAVDDSLLYSYNPKVQSGDWHEQNTFVCQPGNLRFFK